MSDDRHARLGDVTRAIFAEIPSRLGVSAIVADAAARLSAALTPGEQALLDASNYQLDAAQKLVDAGK